MEWLVGLLLMTAGVVAAVIVLGRRAAKRRQAEQERLDDLRSRAEQPADPFQAEPLHITDPRKIVVGCVVEYLGASYAVRGTLTCTEGPYSWEEHHFETPDGRKRWLSVEEDEGTLQVILWTGVQDSDPDTTLGKEVAYNGTVYKRVERGSAAYKSQGTTGLPAGGTVGYADYKGPDGQWFAAEYFDGGTPELSTGETVQISFLRVYPPTGVR